MGLHDRIRGRAAQFRRLLPSASDVQERGLQAILERNTACEYGVRHGFAHIRTYDDFQRHVPIVRYEDLRADILRMASGEQRVLIAAPVVAFEETGGSSGGRKLVPHTDASLESFRRALTVWLDDLYESDPVLRTGTAYWAISPACRVPTRSAAGVRIGLSDAEYFGQELAIEVGQTLSVPPSVGLLSDMEEWQAATMARLLADEALALISVWSPTFMQTLLRYATEKRKELGARLEQDLGSAGAQRIHSALVAKDFRSIWPNLRVLSCWDQASSRGPARELARQIPGVTIQGKGLLATEGIVSIPFSGSAMPVLAIESGFYEFVSADGTCHVASDLVPGEQYEILLTNDSGLYRYAIGDRVRMHEYVGEAPSLEFVGRAGLVSDLCGEKLSEDFVLQALSGTGLAFATLVPDGEGYALLVDCGEVGKDDAATLSSQVDAALTANPQYAYARALRQLAPLKPVLCRNPMANFTSHAFNEGRRLGDVKPPVLLTHGDWRRIFGALPQ
jgi:hypothetical protein